MAVRIPSNPSNPWVLGQTLTTGPFNGATNRWTNQSYDGSGNLTGKLGSGTAVSSYDAENRLVKLTGVGGAGGKDIVYEYDGDGRRVRRVVCVAGTNPCQSSATDAVTTVFVYDASGQLAAEYGGNSGGAGTKYLLSDALGSTRMVLDGTGNAERCLDYAPFGLEIGMNQSGRDQACYGDPSYPAASPDASSVKFTGKERDAESGLDYFLARYMSAAQGRFTSPDAPLIDQHAADPQSWNLYSYVRNQPLNLTDSDGRAIDPERPLPLPGLPTKPIFEVPHCLGCKRPPHLQQELPAHVQDFINRIPGLDPNNGALIDRLIRQMFEGDPPLRVCAVDVQCGVIDPGLFKGPIRNVGLAGKAHPRSGVPFDSDGFPVFGKHVVKEVKIQRTGNRAKDFAAADKAAGFKTTPKGYTWHHHQDGTTMQLVPRPIHAATGHTGGFNLK